MRFEIVDKEVLRKSISEFISLIKGWKYSSWKEENFLYELPGKWKFSFAVYEAKKLSGFCFASNKIADAYYIHLIFLSEEGRGKHQGIEMISYAQSLAKRDGISKIELRCPESNTAALKFYQKAGFTIIEKIKDEISGTEADCYLRKEF